MKALITLIVIAVLTLAHAGLLALMTLLIPDTYTAAIVLYAAGAAASAVAFWTRKSNG